MENIAEEENSEQLSNIGFRANVRWQAGPMYMQILGRSSCGVTCKSKKYICMQMQGKLYTDIAQRNTDMKHIAIANIPCDCCITLNSVSIKCQHIWQFIIFIFFTITACIISYSLSISFRTQDLALQQILSSIDLLLFYRTDYTDSRTMLNGCTGISVLD